MKKLFWILVLGLALSVCGCGEKEEKEQTYETAAEASDASGQIFSSATSFVKKDLPAAYQNENAAKERTGTFLKDSHELSYSETKAEYFVDYDIDVYNGKTEKGIEYQYMAGTDTLLMYHNDAGLELGIAKNAAEDEVYSELEKLLSEELLPQGVDIKQLRRSVITNLYTSTEEEGISTLYSDSREGYVLPGENQRATYRIYYIYPIGGIDTYEMYEFILSEDHLLEQYHTTSPGAFSTAEVKISEKALAKSVESFCKDNLSEASASRKYQMKGQYLYKERDGKLSVVTFMQFESGAQEGMEGERFQLITRLE